MFQCTSVNTAELEPSSVHPLRFSGCTRRRHSEHLAQPPSRVDTKLVSTYPAAAARQKVAVAEALQTAHDATGVQTSSELRVLHRRIARQAAAVDLKLAQMIDSPLATGLGIE